MVAISVIIIVIVVVIRFVVAAEIMSISFLLYIP